MEKKPGQDLKQHISFWLVPLGILLVLLFINKAATGLIIIGISIFLALAIRPLVNKLNNFFCNRFKNKNQHRTTSVILSYIIIILIIGTILAVISPVVISQTAKFIEQLPQMFENNLGGWDGINKFGAQFGISDLQGEITTGLVSFAKNAFGDISSTLIQNVGGVADVIMKIFLVLVLALLFLLEGPKIVDKIWGAIGAHSNNKATVKASRTATAKMANVVSTYFSHQVFIAIIDGCASMVIVFVLSLIFGFSSDLAISTGLITMIFYLIPMFGQFIGGALVALILLCSSPIAALVFIIVYIVYAQVENNFISPKIQGEALKLPAVGILCAMTIGMYMFGLLGAIVSIPIAGCIRVLFDEYANIKATREQD